MSEIDIPLPPLFANRCDLTASAAAHELPEYFSASEVPPVAWHGLDRAMLDLGPAVLKTGAARVMESLRLAGTGERLRSDTARWRLFCLPRSANIGTARQGNEQKILE